MLSLTIGIIFLLSEATSGVVRLPLRKKDSLRTTVLKKGLAFDEDDFKYQSMNGELLKNYGYAEYFGVIGLGSPKQKFVVLFDTGSADLWITSRKCNLSESFCRIHNKYDSNTSFSYKPEGSPFFFPYVNGNVSGILSTDTLHVASLKVRNQTFGEAVSESPIFSLAKFDGIFGLSLQDTGLFGHFTPIYNMYMQGLTDKPTFSMYLSKSAKGGGEIIFGGSDPKYYVGNFSYTPVVDTVGWFINIDRIKFYSDILCDRPCKTLIDTGATLMMGPKEKIQIIMNDLGAVWSTRHLYYMIDCAIIPDIQPIIIYINGIQYSLTAEDYIIKLDTDTYADYVTCAIGFAEHDQDYWILGNSFLRKYYTEFDWGNRKVGFAQAVQSSANLNAGHIITIIFPIFFLIWHRKAYFTSI